MGRHARGSPRRGLEPRPVERIELSDRHLTLRVVLTVVFLVLGVALIGTAVYKALTPPSGWTEIEADSGLGVTDAGEFVFLYELESKTSRAEQRALTALYTSLSRTAWELFQEREGVDGVNNVYAINRHPNEVLEVDSGLYRAFETISRSGNRTLYLGPVVSRYSGVFLCDEDGQLADFDPLFSDEVREEYRSYARWASDPQSVELELLGENRVRLRVSEDYLRFAQQEGVSDFISFGWMKNAFVADLLAEGLTAAGFTRGVLSSYDGFSRCLDGRGEPFSLQLYHRQEERVYAAAVLRYEGPMSLVSFRDYPVNSLDQLRFYTLSDGSVRTAWLDPADGMSKSSIHDLVCLSPSITCAELALAASGVYIADEFDPAALSALSREDIRSIWCEGTTIRYTGPEPTLDNLYVGDGKTYTLSPFGS